MNKRMWPGSIVVVLGVLPASFGIGPKAGEASSDNQRPQEHPGIQGQGPIVELLSPRWLFNATQPARSTLTAQAPQAEFAGPAETTSSFTLRLGVKLKGFSGEKRILDIPDVLDVRLRQHDPLDRHRQNYPAFRMPDGSVPVLEANLVAPLQRTSGLEENDDRHSTRHAREARR